MNVPAGATRSGWVGGLTYDDEPCTVEVIVEVDTGKILFDRWPPGVRPGKFVGFVVSDPLDTYWAAYESAQYWADQG